MELLKEKEYQFRERLTKLYDGNALLNGKERESSEISFENGVQFVNVKGLPLETATAEFKEFLLVEGGVEKAKEGLSIEFVWEKESLGEFATFKGRVISVLDDKIVINAFDERGSAQAIYDIEKMLKLNGSLFLAKGEYKNRPAFSPRMVHSSYGLDIYPDDYLQNLVKDGVDSIILFVSGVNRNRMGFFDFNEIIDRANKYGLDTYAYSCIKNAGQGNWDAGVKASYVSPYGEEGKKAYEQIYTTFFDAHPGFKGMIFVGESIEFPSKDPNVSSTTYDGRTEDNFPSSKPSPGWWPCEDYTVWLDVVKGAIRKSKPDAEIVFWTYNWGYVNKEARIRLIEKLPTDISLLVTYEMFEKYKLGSNYVMGCDYSLAVAGPGKYFVSEAEAAKARGITLYTMSNSGGRTWDFGMLPVEPIPEQWKARYDSMLKCREDYDLKGLMECHHYGFTPSFISRFEYYCFTIDGAKSNYNTDEMLLRSMKEYFGANGEAVREVMRGMTDVIRTYPPTDEMQYGPMRIGTAYPLCLTKDIKPVEEEGLMFGLNICFNTLSTWDLGRYAPFSIRINNEIKLHKKNVERLKKVIKGLESIENPNEELLRLINTVKYIKCMFITTINAYKFYIERKRLMIAFTKREMNRITARIRKIAKDEIENATESIEYAEKDSSIGYEPSMGYVASPKRIEWKIKQVNFMLNVELVKYEQNLD